MLSMKADGKKLPLKQRQWILKEDLMMHEQDYKKMNDEVEMAETVDKQEGNSSGSKDMTSEQTADRIEDTPPEQTAERIEDMTSEQENFVPKGSDPAPGLKNGWKARRTELVAGLVVGALLVFGAGFGCGSLSTNHSRNHFQRQASAGQEPGSGQDGRIGGGFRDGSQKHSRKGGRGHGPCFGGGQDGSDNRQDKGNPPAGNRPGAPDGMNPGTDINGQPDQDSDPSKDSTSQSKDNTTQSKDSTSQSKDSTTQSKNSTPQSTDNTNSLNYGSEL